MYPKFFAVEFDNTTRQCLGIQIDDYNIYMYEGYRLTHYGAKKLENAHWIGWISAKEFTDMYIEKVFASHHQKDCVISNKVFQILIDDDRSMVSKDVVKEAVLKGLSTEYALDEKYF